MMMGWHVELQLYCGHPHKRDRDVVPWHYEHTVELFESAFLG